MTFSSTATKTDDLETTTIQPLSNLKYISIRGQVPSSGKELLFITNQFKSLKVFTVYGFPADIRPAYVSPDEIDAFIKYLLNIPRYTLRSPVQKEAKWLNSYYKQQKSMNNNNCNKLDLFPQNNHEKNPCWTITLKNTTVSLEYSSLDPEVVKNNMEKLFSKIGHHIQILNVGLISQVSINAFMKIVWQRCPSLKVLKFEGCHIESRTEISNNNDNDQHSISELVLDRVNIHNDALNLLSRSFCCIGSLHMISPKFTGIFQCGSIQNMKGEDNIATRYHMLITLSDTKIDSLSIESPKYDGKRRITTSQDQIVKRDSVTFFVFTGNERQMYYVKYGNEDIICLESYAEFDDLREKGLGRPSEHGCYNKIEISVNLGTLKKFSFLTPRQHFTSEF